MSTQTLGYLNSDYKFKTETCKADLMNGFIEVLPQSNEVAENLVLAFSVALLHVLCVPRQPGWKEGQPLKPPETLRGSRLIRIIPSDNMDFVLAAGLLWSTPSNYYIHSHYGIKACAMCGGGGCGGEEGEGGVGEGNKDTETDYIGDFSEEYLHLEAGEDGGYTGACNDETGEGGEMGGCGGCGGCGAACYGSTSGGGGDGGGHADSGGGGFGDGGYTGGWDHGSVGGGSVGGGSTGGGSCGGGCGGGCGGD